MAFFLSLSLCELGTEVLAVMRPLAPFPDILPGEKSFEGEVEEEDGGDREESGWVSMVYHGGSEAKEAAGARERERERGGMPK